MPKLSFQLKATAAGTGKSVTTTVTNLNPEAGKPVIKEFAQKLNQLTTNAYVETNYVESTNLDTDVDTRTIPTLSISNVPSLADINNNSGYAKSVLTITYNGDGTTYVYRKNGCEKVSFSMYSNTEIVIKKNSESSSIVATGGKFILASTGTNNYQPVEVEYTIQ